MGFRDFAASHGILGGLFEVFGPALKCFKMF